MPVTWNYIKAEDFFLNSSINAQGEETQKGVCHNAQHHGVAQLRKSIKTNKNKEQGKLDLLLKKRRGKKKKVVFSHLVAAWKQIVLRRAEIQYVFSQLTGLWIRLLFLLFFVNTGMVMLDFCAAPFTSLLSHCADITMVIPIRSGCSNLDALFAVFQDTSCWAHCSKPPGFFFPLTATCWFLNP